MKQQGKADNELDKILKTLNFKELPQMTQGQVQKLYLELYHLDSFELYLRLKVAHTFEVGFIEVNDKQTLDYFRGYARAYVDLLQKVRDAGSRRYKL